MPASVHNLADPIHLTGLKIDGFAAESAQPETTVKISTRDVLTSDDPRFYPIAESLSGVIRHQTQRAGHFVNPDGASSLFLIVHSDETAELYIDSIAVLAEMIPKRNVQALEPIYDGDIADIRRIRFPAVSFRSDDKFVYCYREGWKFGLFYDLRSGRDLDVNDIERTLGALQRVLRYKHVYDALGDDALRKRMIDAGWFPFAEIISNDVRGLLSAIREGFDLIREEAALLARFPAERIDRIADRWRSHRFLAKRMPVLEPGLRAFKNADPVACLKIFLTEIEGILRDAHIQIHGNSAGLSALRQFAIDQGIAKAEGDRTLFFPQQFKEYLETYVYAKFNPKLPSSHASRHSIGHGGADHHVYTQVHALQALLTIDQLAFYL